MRWMHGIAHALRHRKKDRYPWSRSSSLAGLGGNAVWNSQQAPLNTAVNCRSWGSLELRFAEFWNFHINCYNCMFFLLCILQHSSRENTKFQFNCSISFRDIKLILMCKFQDIPCTLRFEVKHSKFFCRSFRICIII